MTRYLFIISVQKKPHIKVIVRGNLFEGRNFVNINVKYLACYWLDAGQPTLLSSLPKSDGQEVEFTIGVTTGLHPTVQLSVMKEESFGSSGVYHPSGAGKVSVQMRALRARGFVSHEGDDPLRDREAVGFLRVVAEEKLEQRISGEYRLHNHPLQVAYSV